MGAKEVVHGDYDSATSVKTKSDNPYSPNEYRVLTSSLVAGITGDATTWFMGDFQEQFFWKEIWPLQVFKAQPNSIMEFERDVVARFKVRYFGGIFAVDQRYVVKNTA